MRGSWEFGRQSASAHLVVSATVAVPTAGLIYSWLDCSIASPGA